ncbi:LysR family transcriptional regulator [Plastoroseomonas hellenica]|uniref:LysR family transcriptional regulator n=1 Tax=Plastoroseomonas hellenica TaxID=2687306 RepID=UPI001BADE17E|nr:LysR family transcriptional regulator [Plastoroseomonas hellenica]
MNNRQIEAFAALMKSGTASRAAEILGVSQPAVSRMIADLEHAVGFSLFDRVRSRLIPTPEARLFYRDVEAAFRGMDALRAAAARIRDRGSGELRVASLSALGATLVPRAIARFRQKHPTVRITLDVLLSRDVRDLVASGQSDIGLAADEIDLTGVSHQLFVAPNALCVMPAGHRLAAKPVIGPADLQDEPFIAYAPEDRSRHRLDKVLAEAGVTPRIVVETALASTVYALAAEGIGIGLVNPLFNPGLDRARVVTRPFEPKIAVRSLLILPPDRPKSGLVRDFITALLSVR